MAKLKASAEENIAFLKEQLKFAKEQVLALKEEKDYFKAQVDRLQNALFSVSAPQAYRDMQGDMAGPEVNKEAKEHQKKLTGMYKQYLENLESPLFKDAEDMERMLEGVVLKGTNLSGKSAHENSES